MTAYQLLEKLLKSDLITLALGGAACLLTALLKRYVKNKKARTLLPFCIAALFSLLYGAALGDFSALSIAKRALSVGTCATAIYVFYKRFFTGENLKKTKEALTETTAELLQDVSNGEDAESAVKDAVLSLTERLEESVVISETHEISIVEKETK